MNIKKKEACHYDVQSEPGAKVGTLACPGKSTGVWWKKNYLMPRRRSPPKSVGSFGEPGASAQQDNNHGSRHHGRARSEHAVPLLK
jgi:hypothetical protein